MSKFCAECGQKLPIENIKFCPECGTSIILSSLQFENKNSKPNPPPTNLNVETKPITETSRLSNLKIEKFLIPNEIAVYTTRGSLYVGGEEGLKGYVTNNRVIFYASKGLIFKSDRLHEIPLKDINYYKIVEEGIVFKIMYLRLNDLRIKGDREDILELYRSIQIAKQAK
jgi:hypothetical protein